jgi:hypothetical protein
LKDDCSSVSEAQPASSVASKIAAQASRGRKGQ